MSETTITINIKIPENQRGLIIVIKRAIGFFKMLVEKLERGERV